MEYPALRGRIVEKFGSCKAFAEYIGTRPSYISKKLSGKMRLNTEDVLVWSKTLDIPTENIGFYFFNY